MDKNSWEETWKRSIYKNSHVTEREILKSVNDLINLGVDVNMQDPQSGATPLIKAAEFGYAHVVKKLLAAGANVNLIQNRTGYTALLAAVEKGEVEIVETLLNAKDIDVNKQDNKGMAALHRVSWPTQIENAKKILELLLERKDIDVNLKSKEGASAFLYCIDKPELVEIFLKHKDVDINEQVLEHKMKPTALACAVADTDKTQTLDLLLRRRDLKLDTQVVAGYTPLMLAVHFGDNIEKAKRLVAAGANIDIKSDKGQTAYNIAVIKKRQEFAKLLENTPEAQKQREELRDEWKMSFWEDSWQTIDFEKDSEAQMVEKAKSLLKRGARINMKKPDGHNNPPLSFAAFTGKAELVQLLIDNKANIDHKNSMGFTPLMAATIKGHTQIVQKLLDAGANTNIARKGKTALDMAKEYNRKDIEKLLIEAQEKRKKGLFSLLAKKRIGRT